MDKAKSAVVILLSFLVIAAVASIVATRQAESSDAGSVGRYQIVAGCYESTVGDGLPDREDRIVRRGGVFRIDTATGETWVLSERIDKSSIIELKYEREWVRID